MAAKLRVWCREQDLNLHAFWALDPKSNASANSAIPARFAFNNLLYTIASRRFHCSGKCSDDTDTLGQKLPVGLLEC
jgi:hypothetical protein